ncbi:MAG: tetratricopeptide repeat protein [bacterium]|nr:tetratricopeptide repeat protein [bacterium]
MKWILTVFVVAVLLIGAGVVLTDGDGGGDAVSADPEAHLLCEEGMEYLHSFRWNRAVETLSEALELDPTLAEASVGLVHAYANLARGEDAKSELARADSLTAALADDSRRLVAAFRLSRSAGSRYFSMADSLMKSLENEQPRNLYLLVTKARSAYDEGDEELAKRRWKEVIEVDPNFTDSYNMLGYGELNRGNYEAAIDYMQKYAFLAPELANPHDSLGEVYMVVGRYEDAEAQFVQAIQKQPDFYHSLINLGRVHLKRGQVAKGTDILERVRKQVATTDMAQRVDQDIITMYRAGGLDEELDRLTASFVTTYPSSDISPFYRAVRMAYMGNYREGQAVMDSCVSTWRGSSYYAISEKVRFNVDLLARIYDGIVADISGETQTAVRVWQNVVDTIADVLPVRDQADERFAFASALHNNGQHDPALEVLEPLMAVNSRDFKVLELAVECYVATNRPDAARAALERYKWCTERSDPDFPARERAPVLEELVRGIEVDS